MEDNYLIEDPLKIIIYDPLERSVLNKIIFIGKVPPKIKKAIQSISKNNTASNKILRQYYGNNWKVKLGIENSQSTESILSNKSNNVKGSNDFIETYSGFYEEYLNDDNYINSDKIGGIDELYEDDEFYLDEESLQELEQDMENYDKNISESSELLVNYDGSTEYIYDIHTYPEDNMMDIRKKLFTAINLPIYRQHLFYIIKGIVMVPYKMTIFDSYHSINITKLNNFKNNIGEIPMDRYIYNNKGDYMIKALDTFQNINNNLYDNEIYIVDLDYMLDKIEPVKNSILEDVYQIEIMYYSFILKYWPFITLDFFNKYLISRQDGIKDQYPFLELSKEKMNNIILKETNVIDNLYKNMNTSKFTSISNTLKIAVTNLEITFINELPNNINVDIRNLYDSIRMSDNILKLIGYIEYSNNKYEIIKENIMLEKIKNYKKIVNPYKTGLTIILQREQYNKFIYVNISENGKVLSSIDWYDELNLSIEDAVDIIISKTNKLLNYINTFDESVFVNPIFKDIPLLSKKNYKILNMNIVLFWDISMSVPNFKGYRRIIKEYMESDITESYLIQGLDNIIFKFKKGMTRYNKIFSYRLDLPLINEYIYLVDKGFHERWDYLFGGKKTIINHRVSDIKFELFSVDEGEFYTQLDYLVNTIYLYLSGTKEKSERVSNSDNKLRRLREKDPNLYNLKKYGSPYVYARLCQSKFQPDIIEKAEYDKNKNKKNYVKFHNYTYNRDEYYKCPNPKYPYITFRPEIHPKNYCLPCCKKHVTDLKSKKYKVTQNCLTKYVVTEFDSDSGHIMKYGKELDENRFSLLNDTITNLLCLDTCSLLLYGVNQENPYLSIISVMKNMEIAPLINKVIDYISTMSYNKYKNLLNGELINYFITQKEFIECLIKTYVNPSDKYVTSFSNWYNLFVEIFILMYSIYPINIVDEAPSANSSVYLDMNPNVYSSILSNTSNIQYVLICQIFLNNSFKYYPIFIVNYHNNLTNNIIQFSYDINSVHMNNINKLVILNKNIQTKNVINLENIKKLSINNPTFKIIKKYINNKNLCYGLLLDSDIYLPIELSINIDDDIPVSYSPYIRSNFTNSHSDSSINSSFNILKYIIKILNIKVTHNILLNSDNSYIGFIDSDNRYYYHANSNSKLYKDLPDKKILYDYTDVNKYIYNSSISDKNSNKLYNKLSNVPNILYENYMYKLILIEFNNYINKYKDMKMRKQIVNIINKYNIKKDFKNIKNDISNLLRGSSNNELDIKKDLKSIMMMLINFYYGLSNKKQILENIENLSYEFDNKILFDLIKLSKDEIKKIIDQLVIIETSPYDIDSTNSTSNSLDFPNVLIPCATGINYQYCSNKKLIVSNDNIDKYVDILYNDIQVNLRDMNTTIIRKYFKFVHYENENIIINNL